MRQTDKAVTGRFPREPRTFPQTARFPGERQSEPIASEVIFGIIYGTQSQS